MEEKAQWNGESSVRFFQRDFQSDSDEKGINVAYKSCGSDGAIFSGLAKNKIPWIFLVIVLTILFGCIFFVIVIHYKGHAESSTRFAQLENQDEIFQQLAKEMEFKNDLTSVLGEANNTAQALEDEIKNYKETIRGLEEKVETLIKANEEMKRSFEESRRAANENAAHLQQDINTLREETNNTVQMLPGLSRDVVETANIRDKLFGIRELDCGGIITIPTFSTAHFVSYKGNQMYANNERCLWTLENVNGPVRQQLTIQLKVISEGFGDNDDELYAFTFDRGTNLSSRLLNTSNEYQFLSKGFFLSFTSNDNGQGRGFYLRISITSSGSNYPALNKFYRQPNSYSVTSYQNFQLYFVIVQPQGNTNFTVVQVRTESGYDFLYVHEILEQGAYNLKGTLHGTLQNPLAFRTTNPILCIFTADGSNNGEGFEISWTS